MEKKTNTTARVTLTLEYTVGTWGPESNLDQVYRQAEREAIAALTHDKQGHLLPNVRVVGAPKIAAIIVEKS